METKNERIVNKIMERLTEHDNAEMLKYIKKVVTKLLEEENEEISSIYDDDEIEEEEEYSEEDVVGWVLEILMNL
jgi:uncharacterized membrane-anchored protein YjiN (DUF445 family)